MSKPVEIGSGLISATMVATALTAGIVSIVASVEDLVWLIESNRSIAMWPVELVFSIVGTAGLGVVFGFIGAALFLAVAILPLIKSGSQRLDDCSGRHRWSRSFNLWLGIAYRRRVRRTSKPD